MRKLPTAIPKKKQRLRSQVIYAVPDGGGTSKYLIGECILHHNHELRTWEALDNIKHPHSLRGLGYDHNILRSNPLFFFFSTKKILLYF